MKAIRPLEAEGIKRFLPDKHQSGVLGKLFKDVYASCGAPMRASGAKSLHVVGPPWK